MRPCILVLLSLAACTTDPKDTAPDDTAPDDTAPDDTGDEIAPGDILALMAAAEEIAWVEWPAAVLIDAGGTIGSLEPPDPTRPEHFVNWCLVLLANDGAETSSIEIGWRAGQGFDAPIYHTDPYYGVMDEPIPRTMDLEDALGAVEEAGQAAPFWAVALNTPIWPAVDVRYAFAREAGNVFVDVATGTVSTK
jgi:hypothetical protein